MARHPETPEYRSWVMQRVRSVDTAPEMRVRKLLHALGYRFRLHGKQLPGRPDVVFAKRKKVVFVHGCFWHQHDGPSCKRSRLPKTRREFWSSKLSRNRRRDEENLQSLEEKGWSAAVVWECQLRDPDAIAKYLLEFLGPPNREAHRADGNQ